MEFVHSLRRLWRHRYFRRLLAVRIATQSCDGLLQTALASYVLFSPERQPDAGSVAAVLAITLLPFSVLGPFVGVVLDRWQRRQILVLADLTRSALAVGLAALVATGLRTPGIETLFYGGVLLTMSVNRFLLAALSSSLPHTIDPDEYLVANAVVPTVGPAGVLVGVGVGTGLRLLLGGRMPAYSADAALFAVAALGFVFSASLALRIPRRQLGPDTPALTTARTVLAGLLGAFRHLGDRRPAAVGLTTIGAHRLVYGVVTVATILVYRNHFHSPEQVDAAIADLGLLVVVTGAGFVLAAAITPVASARVGVRGWMLACLVSSGVFQVMPGAIYRKPALLIAAFLLGITAQSIKICVDTLVQAHVDDHFKGRVFVIYDMIFNLALVTAAAVGALLLPDDGKSVVIVVALAVSYLIIGAVFAAVSRGLDLDSGTESLHSVANR
ncbi:MAG TPA: MFS transporter [Propionibacteriaceae bacterium]|nr:MFS transporter [Propionibacteriaceae bacterium]